MPALWTVKRVEGSTHRGPLPGPWKVADIPPCLGSFLVFGDCQMGLVWLRVQGAPFCPLVKISPAREMFKRGTGKRRGQDGEPSQKVAILG